MFARQSLGPGETRLMNLPPLIAAVLFVYLPVRLHDFVDEPGDRSNHAWFWLTVLLISIHALTGLSLL